MEIENHRYVVSDHELILDGKIFNEKKEYSKITNDSKKSDEISKLIHTRSIDERYYLVTQNMVNGKIEGDEIIVTNMETEEDKNSFMDDWNANWHPTLGQPSNGILGTFRKFLKF